MATTTPPACHHPRAKSPKPVVSHKGTRPRLSLPVWQLVVGGAVRPLDSGGMVGTPRAATPAEEPPDAPTAALYAQPPPGHRTPARRCCRAGSRPDARQRDA